MARSRLQIHLSTCVALVFAAGGLLWANTTTRIFFFHGFPYIAFSDVQFDGEVSETYCEYLDRGLPEWRITLPSGFVVLPLELAWDVAISIGALAMVTLCCEFVLPRLIRMMKPHFRFHLATLLAVTVGSGALLILNLREIEYPTWGAFEASSYSHHGWPWDAVVTYDYDQMAIRVDARVEFGLESGEADDIHFWDIVTPMKSVVICPLQAALNLQVCFILLASLAFICEYYLRRQMRVRHINADTASPAPPAQSASGS